MSNYRILIIKELKQIMADRSIFALAFLLPVILVFIYGSAVRMEVKPVSIAIVCEQDSKLNHDIINEFAGSDYFNLTVVPSFGMGEELLCDNSVKALLILSSQTQTKGGIHEYMIFLNGVESQLASISRIYIESTLSSALDRYGTDDSRNSQIRLNVRNYFNEKNESVYFLMSGQYVSIITLLCIFLGSFVIAREWDRGTIESLCATSATAAQIVLSKIAVYYVIVLCSVIEVITLGQTFYQIPIRGSLILLFISLAIYSLELLCLGILISAKLKNQFTATQIAVVIGFLPTVMLSGLIFDLKAVEPFIHVIGIIIPPTYEVKAMRIIFMSGGSQGFLLMNLLIQSLWTLLFITLTVKQVKKDCK
ncbi:MAG: ABC transporter permease [Succinivibrio sp.]